MPDLNTVETTITIPNRFIDGICGQYKYDDEKEGEETKLEFFIRAFLLRECREITIKHEQAERDRTIDADKTRIIEEVNNLEIE